MKLAKELYTFIAPQCSITDIFHISGWMEAGDYFIRIISKNYRYCKDFEHLDKEAFVAVLKAYSSIADVSKIFEKYKIEYTEPSVAVLLTMHGLSVKDFCEFYNISRPTAYSWQNSRPHTITAYLAMYSDILASPSPSHA